MILLAGYPGKVFLGAPWPPVRSLAAAGACWLSSRARVLLGWRLSLDGGGDGGELTAKEGRPSLEINNAPGRLASSA